VGEGRSLLREIFCQPVPVGAKLPILNRYSAVTPGKKVQLTLTGATYDVHLRLIGKRIVNFLLVSIELFC